MTGARPRILVVDDEPHMGRSLQLLLSEERGYEVEVAGSGDEAVARLSRGYDVVVSDITMPGMDGLALLRGVKDVSPETEVVLMTAYSTVKSAIDAIRAGAFEYLIKPFDNDQFVVVVENALKVARLARENRDLKSRLGERPRGESLIGGSAAMARVRYLVDRAAESDATVLITGESGTGKEIIARAIHGHGPRRKGPFVALNCTALPETLLETELFGYERGAFTGAAKTKPGKFELASDGTLFFDEVGDMEPALQTKLLRVLETRSFERVGGVEVVKVDVRFIAATNRPLEKAIADGAFREDLYYRLNVISIHAPTLRERREDIPMLIDHIVAKRNLEAGDREPVSLSDGARARLLAYDYPGNVRELENLIERATVLAKGPRVEADDLPALGGRGAGVAIEQVVTVLDGAWGVLQGATKDLERQLIARALREWAGAPNEVIAERLGTSRRILELRMQEFGFRKDERK
ncbi:MAG: sigma-54-dependent Fis family transcriptional regulator [Deltaproteobacteria bacterium]|nr:sigma-54-dependent Fis family transcriptional regulator [Deltaproteobacteria bacterium]